MDNKVNFDSWFLKIGSNRDVLMKNKMAASQWVEVLEVPVTSSESTSLMKMLFLIVKTLVFPHCVYLLLTLLSLVW